MIIKQDGMHLEEGDIAKIRELLKPDYFNDENAASTLDEMQFFRTRKPNYAIYPGDLFLCDVYGNEMWIVRLSTKKKALPARDGHSGGRKVMCEPVAIVLESMKGYHRWNGYWRIPQEVVTQEVFN